MKTFTPLFILMLFCLDLSTAQAQKKVRLSTGFQAGYSIERFPINRAATNRQFGLFRSHELAYTVSVDWLIGSKGLLRTSLIGSNRRYYTRNGSLNGRVDNHLFLVDEPFDLPTLHNYDQTFNTGVGLQWICYHNEDRRGWYSSIGFNWQHNIYSTRFNHPSFPQNVAIPEVFSLAGPPVAFTDLSFGIGYHFPNGLLIEPSYQIQLNEFIPTSGDFFQNGNYRSNLSLKLGFARW